MRTVWVSDDVRAHYDNAMVEWDGTEGPECEPEEMMKALGWRLAPLDVEGDEEGLVINATDLLALGAEYGERGVETITLMFTRHDLHLWIYEGVLGQMEDEG